jgi:diaminopimelate decarboxylase
LGDTATAAPNPICLTGLAADLWPHSAQLEADGDISVGGLRLSALAGRYGTPAYILDEADVRARCRAYTDAFPGAEIAYAGKAFLCRRTQVLPVATGQAVTRRCPVRLPERARPLGTE